ncbi:MAG: phosphotransacetylase family protein [Candidatus Bathyarchaeia archaeon]
MVKRTIYVTSTRESSGKSAIIIALASLATEMGKRVGYFKPIGIKESFSPGREHLDEDAEMMRLILKLKHESNTICPLMIEKEEFLENFMEADISSYIIGVKTAYEKVSEGVDIMFIEGPHNFSTGSFIECSVPRLAGTLGADILLVERFSDDSVVDDVLQVQDCCMKWGTKLFGVILNRIPLERVERVKRIIKPFMEKHGVRVLGLVPEDKSLSAPTVREICDFIGGRVLAGKDGLDRTIETVLIGAMTPDSAAKYFRKVANELVITGGDRTDIILTALETDVSAIILTGNLYPSVKVFPKADQLKVPLISVPYDTYTTLQHIQKIIGKIKPGDPRRVSAAVNLVRKYVDWKEILG